MALPTGKGTGSMAAMDDGDALVPAIASSKTPAPPPPSAVQANPADGPSMPPVVAPYDECTKIDPPNEEDDEDVLSDDESMNQKSCFTMLHLNQGRYDKYWKGPNYGCPFCSRKLANDFLAIMQHAQNSLAYSRNMRQTDNPSAFKAKHAAYGVFLHREYNKRIEAGLLPPPRTPEEKAADKRRYSAMARKTLGSCSMARS